MWEVSKMTSKSILVSEMTHSSLFLLQAKLMVQDKTKYSMNVIIEKLLIKYDNDDTYLRPFKLENIEPDSTIDLSKLENIET